MKRKSIVDTRVDYEEENYRLENTFYTYQTREDGGIGRHERLKISWLHGRAGSSPALRTRIYVELDCIVQLDLYSARLCF